MTPPAPAARRRGRRRGASFLQILALWLLGWWGIVGALLAPVMPGRWAGALALAVVTSLPLGMFLLRGRGKYPGAAFRLLVARPFWYVQLALPVVGTAGAVGALAGLPFGAAGIAGRWALAGAAAFYAAVMAAGYVGSRRMTVTPLVATIPDLPPALDGLRVVQLSDLHVGPHTPRRQLARAARAVAAARPDLIAVTGDQVDDNAPDVAHYAAAFGALQAPLGVYVIPGNHDAYAGWRDVHRRFAAAVPGQTMLVNEARVVHHNGAALAVVGVGDPAAAGEGAGPDPDAALRRVPRGAFVLALAHNPVLWPALAERGVPLTLSGHTHWGQFAIPRLGWSLATPFLEHAMGAHRAGRSLLYIHPGTNYWGIPFRLGTPPEIAVITLRRGDEAGIERGRGETAR